MAGDVRDPSPDAILTDAYRVSTVDELGKLLRGLRRRHARRTNDSELTVRALAGRSGYAYGVISEYLSGKALAPTDRFDVLVRMLGAGPAEQRALATARDRVAERRRSRRASGLVPRELPPAVHGFTGRDGAMGELDELLHRPNSGIGLACAITGTAGVGKTALAVHWAHRVDTAFPDGCLYVDLQGYGPDRPVAPAEALARFLRSLGLDGADIPYDEADRAARYRSLLADRRMLIVLDNARDTDQVRSLLPGGAHCGVVVTSRDALAGLVVRHGAHRIGLDALAPDCAVELLGLLVGTRVREEPEATVSLADRCVRLPLMLRLTAELAGTRPGTTLAELDAELADVQHRLDRLDVGAEPRTDTRAVFSWSYQNLSAEVARAFRLLGLFPGHDLDEYTMAALGGVSLDQARTLLANLSSAHLVQRGRSGRYVMHDLLRVYAAELVTRDPEPEQHAAMSRLLAQQLAACAAAMDQAAPFDSERRPVITDPGWPLPALTDPDRATSWLDRERSNLIATAVHAADDGRPDHAGTLAMLLVRYLDTGAHYRDAELLYLRVIAGASPRERAHSLTSLGIVCWRLGRYEEAITHHERALEIARRIGDKPELGRALTGLGIVYWQRGRTAEAIESSKQATDLYREIGDRIGQARALGNLGCIYDRVGDLVAAVRHHQQAMELFREAGDPVGMANELGGLGSTQQRLGRLPEALSNLGEALALARLAGHREGEAQALDELGTVHRRLGRPTEAARHHREALDLARQTGDRAAEGYALGNLGAAYALLGRQSDAIEHQQRALVIASDIGDDHLTAELLNALGDALQHGDRPGEAVDPYQRALVITARTGNSYQQARAHHGLARTLDAVDDAAEALRHAQQARALDLQLGVPATDESRELPGRHPTDVAP